MSTCPITHVLLPLPYAAKARDPNADTRGHVLLRLNDAWAQACDLKHERRRPAYVAVWSARANRAEAARRLEAPMPADEATMETT